ncbi:hypothetical protein EVAR_80396_1 [Eumeta japonica]|uniref:Uncharacterized protein n=1 Tax=Eumeta variegata TaxID=151549 RepID=A0A4C1VJM0_EUMVA|nr:hypothetical protein EVAR_80396_1 [Eumeta japonica]
MFCYGGRRAAGGGWRLPLIVLRSRLGGSLLGTPPQAAGYVRTTALLHYRIPWIAETTTTRLTRCKRDKTKTRVTPEWRFAKTQPEQYAYQFPARR